LSGRQKARFPLSSAQRLRTSQGGFTLIEVLIVVSLMIFIVSIGLPNFGMAIKLNLTNSNRDIANIIRSAHDEAVLKGQVYRIAFDIAKSQYWVELGERNYLMRTDAQTEEERRRIEHLSREEREKIKDPFSLAQGVTKKKISLPTGVKFTEIRTSHNKEPIKDGIAYAYAFPHGFVERSVVYLKDSLDRESTLIVSPVSGKSKIVERYIKDIDQ